MADPLTWFALLTLFLATYVSALTSSLMIVRSAGLERRLTEIGVENASAHWLVARLDRVRLSASFLRTVLRLLFFALVLTDVAGMGETSQLTWTGLALAGGVSVVALWICATVVANAVARYVGETLILMSRGPLLVMRFVSAPAVWGVGFVDEAVRRLTGANLRDDEEAERQLLRSVEETQRDGAIDEAAAAMIENVVEFGGTDVGAIMTPRTDIEGLEIHVDLPDIRQFVIQAGHSRIPVYDESLDDIVGILYVKDLIKYLGETPADFDLRRVLRKPLLVPDTKPVPQLLGDFQRSEVHLAIVIDEYGGTAGLVTIEDVLEEIVGEIHDEHEPDDEEDPQLERVDEHRAEVDGRYHIDDLNEELGLDLPEDEDYDTVAGFLLAQLGRVPETGETLEAHRARFEVTDATPTTVQRVRVELIEEAAATNGVDGGNGV